MPKRKDLRAIILPPNWKATVESFLRESFRDNPEKLKEVLRILNEKSATEDRGENMFSLFTEAALQEFVHAGASGSVEDLREFASMIGICASVKIEATKKYPKKYFRDLAAAIRLVMKEDPFLFQENFEEAGFWAYSYEEFAAAKGKPGRKRPVSDKVIGRLSRRLKTRFGRPCDEVVAALLRAMYPEAEYDARYIAERRRRLGKMLI